MAQLSKKKNVNCPIIGYDSILHVIVLLFFGLINKGWYRLIPFMALHGTDDHDYLLCPWSRCFLGGRRQQDHLSFVFRIVVISCQFHRLPQFQWFKNKYIKLWPGKFLSKELLITKLKQKKPVVNGHHPDVQKTKQSLFLRLLKMSCLWIQ